MTGMQALAGTTESCTRKYHEISGMKAVLVAKSFSNLRIAYGRFAAMAYIYIPFRAVRLPHLKPIRPLKTSPL
jgi:hypothetical protein